MLILLIMLIVLIVFIVLFLEGVVLLRLFVFDGLVDDLICIKGIGLKWVDKFNVFGIFYFM